GELRCVVRRVVSRGGRDRLPRADRNRQHPGERGDTVAVGRQDQGGQANAALAEALRIAGAVAEKLDRERRAWRRVEMARHRRSTPPPSSPLAAAAASSTGKFCRALAP